MQQTKVPQTSSSGIIPVLVKTCNTGLTWLSQGSTWGRAQRHDAEGVLLTLIWAPVLWLSQGPMKILGSHGVPAPFLGQGYKSSVATHKAWQTLGVVPYLLFPIDLGKAMSGGLQLVHKWKSSKYVYINIYLCICIYKLTWVNCYTMYSNN